MKKGGGESSSDTKTHGGSNGRGGGRGRGRDHGGVAMHHIRMVMVSVAHPGARQKQGDIL